MSLPCKMLFYSWKKSNPIALLLSLQGLRDVISNMILPKYKLEQFYQVDNEATVDRFRQLVRGTFRPVLMYANSFTSFIHFIHSSLPVSTAYAL